MVRRYIHGTCAREQQRLIAQAEQFAELLSSNLEVHPRERLLEIGCGVGAVLGVISRHHPHVSLHGIDISPEQIDGARRHLHCLGCSEAELVVGDGAALPWPNNHFHRVKPVWVLEHLTNPVAVLQEALRVLKPGGTIHLTETDYASLRTAPPDAAIDTMLQAFTTHFHRHGNAHAGPCLGPWLEEAGYVNVSNQMVGLHYWCPSQRNRVQSFANYLLGFISPEEQALINSCSDHDQQQAIRKGFQRFAELGKRNNASISISIYQAKGSKSASLC